MSTNQIFTKNIMSNKKVVRANQKTTPSVLSGLSLELVGFGVVVAGTLAFSVVSYTSPASVAHRQGQVANRLAATESQIATAQIERDATFADRRYNGACTLLAQEFADKRYKAIAITANRAIADIHTGGALAPGDVICDDNGMTAEIGADGKATNFYRSYDTALINGRVEASYGWAKEFVRSSPGEVLEVVAEPASQD